MSPDAAYPPLCSYCGHPYDEDLHHDDPAQDDHWPEEAEALFVAAAEVARGSVLQTTDFQTLRSALAAYYRAANR